MKTNTNWKLINKNFINNLLVKNYNFPNSAQIEIFDNLYKSDNSIIVAPTGTGKTLAIIIYLIDFLSIHKNVKAFFILPTKELINQVYDICKELQSKDFIKIAILNKIKKIENIIDTNLILATPEKLNKFTQEIHNHFSKFQLLLVLDEVDTLIEMGFLNDIQLFLKTNNSNFKKKIAASATIPKGLMQQLKIWFKKFNSSIYENKKITKSNHYYLFTREEKKKDDLLRILEYYKNTNSKIVFCNTKKELINLYHWVKENSIFHPILFHGNLQEKERNKMMNIIKNNENIIIFSSDLLARGISLRHLQTVINFELPKDNIWYMHRSGRTGRYEQPGQIINLIFENEFQKIKELEKKDISFLEATLGESGLKFKQKKFRKFKNNELIENEIKKIVSSTPKEVKPNYKKRIKAKIRKVKIKAKRKALENNIKKELVKKWKNESKIKRIEQIKKHQQF